MSTPLPISYESGRGSMRPPFFCKSLLCGLLFCFLFALSLPFCNAFFIDVDTHRKFFFVVRTRFANRVIHRCHAEVFLCFFLKTTLRILPKAFSNNLFRHWQKTFHNKFFRSFISLVKV